ncbi:uncharacterized protein EI90DRAFT_3040228 [Cantharellus anzutake]|uniref:uncharacterized protein n=1 Tax=Cantharellus anzutake TaxID=1750568 RepID=UPI001906FA01|nr:uncharacterized protein EI90DRAFT_3040228 [Cantharellus anzutake]KAF8339084.1 hypothetical protein EI90DRAFT_3040228 [Cantharellus anzutake]
MWDGMFVYQEPRDLGWLSSLAAATSPRAIGLVIEVSQKALLTEEAGMGLSAFMQPNAHRIGKLHITTGFDDTEYGNTLHPSLLREAPGVSLFLSIFELPLPNLSSIHIDLGFTVRIPQLFGGPTCNSLRSIEMHHASLERVEFWKKGFLLECLTLDVDALEAWNGSLHQILSLQSTLQELHLTLPSSYTHRGTEALHFPNLKLFRFTAISYILLTTLTMPALQCLYLKPFDLDEANPENMEEIAALKTFLSLHASTLKALHYMPINPDVGMTGARLRVVDLKPLILPALSTAVLLVYGQFSYSFRAMHYPNLEELNVEVVGETPSSYLFDFLERNANMLRSLHINGSYPWYIKSPILRASSEAALLPTAAGLRFQICLRRRDIWSCWICPATSRCAFEWGDSPRS